MSGTDRVWDTRKCLACGGSIRLTSVGEDGNRVVRWMRTDRIMVGCPEIDSHGWCSPATSTGLCNLYNNRTDLNCVLPAGHSGSHFDVEGSRP